MRFKRFVCVLLAGIAMSAFPLGALGENVYIATSRDTRPAPDKAVFESVDFSGYALLYETDVLRYYWREDRDVLGIENKQNGRALKTGVDLPFSGDAKDLVKQMKKDGLSANDILSAYQPYADDLNSTYVGIANSLVTIEYIDSDKTKQISSASEKNASSSLAPAEGADNVFVLSVAFSSPDISLNVYLTLDGEGVRYRVPRSEFSGKDLQKLSAVLFTPFLWLYLRFESFAFRRKALITD